MRLKDRLKTLLSARSPEGDSAGTAARDVFQMVLEVTNASLDGVPVPGLKAAIGGVLAIINRIEVFPSNSLPTPLQQLTSG